MTTAMRYILACFFLTLFCHAAFAQNCTVAEPDGKPLPVRDAPRGIEIGTLSNGDGVNVERSADDDRGYPWAMVSGAASGWVFQNYLDCATAATSGFFSLDGLGEPEQPQPPSNNNGDAGPFSLACSFTSVEKKNGRIISQNRMADTVTIDLGSGLFKWKGDEPAKMFQVSELQFKLTREFGTNYSKLEIINRQTGGFFSGMTFFGVDTVRTGSCKKTKLVPFNSKMF